MLLKHFFISIACMWILPIPILAQELKEIRLSFDSNDFCIEQNKKNEGVITFSDVNFTYDEDTRLPCIPYTTVNVAVPSNRKYQGLEWMGDFFIFKKDINLATNPEVLPTTQFLPSTPVSSVKYEDKEYPKKSVEYVCSSVLGDYTILTFKVTPFKYNTMEKVLTFSKSITLNITLTTSKEKRHIYSKPFFHIDDIKQFVINPEDVSENEELESVSSTPKTSSEEIDYLIITSDSLQSSFVPLQAWKKMKGVRTKIITTEYIASNYEGSNMPLKIKNCLYDYYINNGLQYVLLGGDDTIVATQGCYAYVNNDYNYTDMPTDLFYACFGGTFDWNLDGDEIIGEVTDGVDLTPYISVTRAPIRTATDITSFVNKTLTYEKTPPISDWNNQILMCGVKLWDILSDGKSDAQVKGENLYESTIKDIWTGSRKYFYDTNTDFSGGASYNLNISNLQTQISNGYAFIDMITHGYKTVWAMESGSLYSSTNAQSSVGNHPTIITTIACQTNAFDKTPEPCLSEAFIRNPNNGVIAYLGCSREGWERRGTNEFGPSLKYEENFYQKLFSNNSNKGFGKIVAEAKYAMAGDSQGNGAKRWVMFGLNPLGDSEMPIYTTTPIPFDNISITNRINSIIVNTGVAGCTICMMSTDDMGATYYEVRKNVQSAVFDGVNTNVSICVTKPNYIPYISTWGITYIQNETIAEDRSISDNAIIIGSNVNPSSTPGPVLFLRENITVRGNIIRIENGTTLEIYTKTIFTNN